MLQRNARKNFTWFALIIVVCVFCLTLAACQGQRNVIRSANEIEIDYDTSRLIQFEIEMESGAVIGGDLYPLNAPITVRNFVKLCEEGYYDGTQFDYVISDKIVMCNGQNEETTPYTIFGEFSSNNWRNGLTHYKGTMSMARKNNDYDSAYAKFFIILENRTNYDGEYASFGKITSGYANLEAISKVDVDGTVPLAPQVIKTIRILGNID